MPVKLKPHKESIHYFQLRLKIVTYLVVKSRKRSTRICSSQLTSQDTHITHSTSFLFNFDENSISLSKFLKN